MGGLDAYSDLSAEQRITLLGRREEFYADEFTEHGLDRVAIAATKNKP